MGRIIAFIVLSGLLLSGTLVKAQVSAGFPTGVKCDDSESCPDRYPNRTYEGKYTGHDEPALLFYSNVPGSGNSSIYRIRLPKDPPTLPAQDGSGGTFNFQLDGSFWFGMALCDGQSAPEFTDKCEPDTDENIFDSPDPLSPRFVGKHPGGAFMELQFYPPGWVVPFAATLHPRIDATRYLVGMLIASDNVSEVTGQLNNLDCLEKVGEETGNYAYITKNGVPVFPPDPLGLNVGPTNPDLNNLLTMNPGDLLQITIHDTRDGLKVFIEDLTMGESGLMVASTANGFAHILFQPDPNPAHPSITCSEQSFAFHPMFSTSNEHTRLTWTNHTYNIAFADEIGHFEYCDMASPTTLACTKAGVNDGNSGGGLDADDQLCFTPSQSFFPGPPFIQIGGCANTDRDFDGVSYQPVWPGALPKENRLLEPEPIRFTSPQFIARDEDESEEHDVSLGSYNRVAFEAELPAIESACNILTGANCQNPPPGANFYPIYTTAISKDFGDSEDGQCVWQFGGAHIPGTLNTFGGNSAAEYGSLFTQNFPVPGRSVPIILNFRRVVKNLCKGGEDHDFHRFDDGQ